MKPTLLLLLIAGGVLLGLAIRTRGQSTTPAAEALTGFDDLSNGFSDPDRRKADQKFFEEIEDIAPEGLGPLYNAQSCRECHQTPVTGAASQVTEVRVGHLDAHGRFQNPQIPINHGAEIIQDRKLHADPEGSYVAKLFSKGINKIAQKVGEEAVELVIEAKDHDEKLFLNEAADLLFHYLILLNAKGYNLRDVTDVLKERHKK